MREIKRITVVGLCGFPITSAVTSARIFRSQARALGFPMVAYLSQIIKLIYSIYSLEIIIFIFFINVNRLLSIM